MKAPQAPSLEKRRAKDFAAELHERAGAWIPSWGLEEDKADFGRALMTIAARFSSEVAERLDGSGEKMRRGFLDWLGVSGKAARPARMPVVFKLADTAPEPVLAENPVRMQADAAGTPVVFETEEDIRIVPGTLEVVVGVDADNDAFFLPPPGLSNLEPLETLPTQWRVKSFAAANVTRFQLDPPAGLLPGTVIESGGQQYGIVKADDDLVTIDRPLVNPLDADAEVTKVTTFSPFDDKTHNQQEHALYLGDSELLNVEAPATIEVTGAAGLLTGFVWQYWGKVDGIDEVKWQPLTPDEEKQKKVKDAIVLTKPKGAVEEYEIGGKKSRWIRAYAKKAEGEPFTADEFGIRINSNGCESEECPPQEEVEPPVAEAMANTTPLVLDRVFFPLGKEPRQFDAFYLGSEEAFSKSGAVAQLCFQMADPTFVSLSSIREGDFADRVLAGVAQDRALHLLELNQGSGTISKFLQRDPLQPPNPGFQGQSQPIEPVALDAKPPWRLPVWFESSPAGFMVGVTAGNAVWGWREDDNDRNQSGWVNLGELPLDTQTPARGIDGLVYLGGASPVMAALRGETLFIRDSSSHPPTWNKTDTTIGGNAVRLKSIVPVLVDNGSGQLVTLRIAGMVGVSTNNKLFHIAADGTCSSMLQMTNFDPTVRPVAVVVGAQLFVAGVDIANPPNLVALLQGSPSKVEPLTAGVVGSLDVVLSGSQPHVIASVADGTAGQMVSWAPYEAGAAASVLVSDVSPSGGEIGGSPTVINGHVVIPGSRADLLVTEFNLAGRRTLTSNISTGVVLPDAVPALAANDLVVREVANVPESRIITEAGRTKDGEVFYPIGSKFSDTAAGPLLAYDLGNPHLAGTFTLPDQLELDASDHETSELDTLWVDGNFFTVDALDRTVDPWVATISSPSAGPMPAAGNYVRPIETGGRVAPFMNLDPSTDQNGDWDADLLDRVPLIFPGKTPREQRGKAFSLALGNRPVIVVLEAQFQEPINVPFEFLLDASMGEWRRQLGDASTNPELSWEYWNGKGWWSLNVLLDETLHLKTSGRVRFDVPSDIASSDWAGKTNYWIRARLIGGDYGREKMTVKTTSLPGNVTEQIVERSTVGISAPSVVRLFISYQICKALRPTYVSTADSGTVRDQSDANRTAGAVVEAFVPLSVTLGRLADGGTPPDAADEPCPPECTCGNHPKDAGPDPKSASPAASSSRETGRSIFLGLNATPLGAPVNVLFLVDEQDHTAFAPMGVDAVIADQLTRIVADDKSRALGESAILSMDFNVPPTRSGLFGRENLTWVRLKPKVGAQGAWLPKIRGAYLNAAWASATETLTRELLGSSLGEPNLTVLLARPPVLYKSLELRVKEPLGEEEREALLKQDKNKVLTNVENLDGDWVLWEQVIDPADEPADARVYSLDENTGEIRFGDGIHGRIPPIGRDVIVAFRYSRTERDPSGGNIVPGNLIAPRTALNLVSPVESVENVTAAEQAAGGAPPESDEQVLRFGFARLRHRDRAVTAYDIEDLALQSSPDIVQARAFRRRDYVELVVVIDGDDPAPSAAQMRELRRLLLAAAPVSLSAKGAFRISGPRVRRLRIDLELRVERLDFAGELTEFVKRRLSQFFNSATGGSDKEGWLMGVNPTEGDIALALLDAPRLESLKRVKLWEVADDGRLVRWPSGLRPNELVMLDDDPVRIDLEPGEGTV
jgi:hypothetical protein